MSFSTGPWPIRAEGHDYGDNAERFILFSKSVVEIARRISPPLDLIHVHDWQTALVPVLIRERRLPFRTVLTIHNLAYQGSFWGIDFGLTNLPGHYFHGQRRRVLRQSQSPEGRHLVRRCDHHGESDLCD
jgi:glycogen synthase